MVTSDNKTASSRAASPPAFEEPPPYVFADENGPSPSTASSPPKDTLHLYQGPPNAEPILGRASTPEDVLSSIRAENRGHWLVTDDERLQDPTILYDWLRRQALTHSALKLRCTGVHFETPERNETVQDRDGMRQRRKGQPERITDFDFTINITPSFAHPDNFANVHLSTVSPDYPTHRGTHSPTYSALYAPPVRPGTEYASILGPTDAGRQEIGSSKGLRKEWSKWRVGRGLPDWIKMEDTPEFWDSRGKGKGVQGQGALALGDRTIPDGVAEEAIDHEDLKRAATEPMLKAWCEKFTQDQGLLKEFIVPIAHWGWDFEGLITATKGAITSTGYNSNHLTVDCVQETSLIDVRPHNYLSMAVHTTWIYMLLWLTLIYPCIWVWQRLHPRGGGPYSVAKIHYGLKYYPRLPSTFPGETVALASERLPGMYKVHPELPKPAMLVPGPKGVHYLLGRKEGEWFREWEERIKMAARCRYVGEIEGGSTDEAGSGLDGY